MQTSLSWNAMAAMAVAMVALAALPSTSVLAVSARAAASGFGHGALAAAGVVAGDIVFIALALFGLALIVDALGGMAFVIRYLGGAYLIWLGVSLWRAEARAAQLDGARPASPLSSFMTGLLITLGDQKAILFYLGFFPAFLDLERVSLADAGVVVAITVVAVGGTKLVYAWIASRAGRLFGARAGRAMNRIAACIMIAVGAVLLAGA